MPSSPDQPPPRIQIEEPAPRVDCGRYPAKACVGDTVDVFATIFKDGHDILRAVARYRAPGSEEWHEAPMRRIDAHVDGDRWQGSFRVTAQGRWTWSVQTWTDAYATWHSEIERKVAAGQDEFSGELSEGAVLLRDAAVRAGHGADADRLTAAADHLTVDAALDPELLALTERYPDRTGASVLDAPLIVDVDRPRARFGAWYELFPRSWGGLRGVQEAIPQLAELGFDVLYLPPIHPIGTTNRKGRNNALQAGPDDPGSPWAIGSAEGGHDAIHPDLGTIEDFDAMVATAREHGIDIALDFAIQCSPDHPWLKEHPEWFHRRPDGTLKYAENPPKRYQDIYNVNWDTPDWEALWDALRDVVMHWVDHGVRAFRVDNPHTKPLPFWEWLIGEVRAVQPDTIFLAEAFTRRAMMRTLAKVGFSQSYTYFTWKNSRWELTEYVNELAHSGMQDYYRPNFFVNTPDILTEYLQHGGPPAFAPRLILAATLSPTYGIYSGFEHFENVPVRPGSEEYLDSEKYEIKDRRLDGPLLPLVGRLNEIRRDHPALQHLGNVTFLETENDALIAYAKRHSDDVVICVVNIDPHNPQEGVAVIPYELGLPPVFPVVDLLGGERFDWQIGRNFVRLHPPYRAAHVLTTVPR
ncbi:alpha-1,4-glucan--maltose-1-phosphate maltosyltransferase [Capillimicrobium parvum]|uniref:alpha-1,4-glucan--maltose-1-phosphate maltosyltransferase n=1 Tax=Capillimicrobium parvum TaxID=2884022 RepID=UPI00216ABBF0|nr:alpha-1,4-glucan--maltose-1-phosphate maltosyltransferase [Capillimicrobium parvum]